MAVPDFRVRPPTRRLTPTRTLPIVRNRRRRNRSKDSRLWRLPSLSFFAIRRLLQGGWFEIGGRGRSRTYRGRRAPSNGFEVRASHRARYSSAPRLAEHPTCAQAGQVEPAGGAVFG